MAKPYMERPATPIGALDRGAGALAASGLNEPPPAAWQQAVIRLANSTERLSAQIAQLIGTPVVTPPEVRDLVERLIGWLDQVDGDPDPEDGADDEPSLGSHEIEPAGAVSYMLSWARVAGLDVEEQCDDERITV